MRYFILILMTLSFTFGAEEVAKPLPIEAQKAVEAMEAQINKARYDCLVKLKKITADITRTGNLEAAMLVKAKETEIVKEYMTNDTTAPSIVGKWKYTHAVNGWSGVVTIDEKLNANDTQVVGKAKMTSKNSFMITWAHNNNDIDITWDASKQAYIGKHINPSGLVTTAISLTKIVDSK